MLGWVLRRGLENATGASGAPVGVGDDTTQLEQPETPAPVFAARALKTAIFGEQKPTDGDETANMPAPNPKTDTCAGSNTPTKPPGILLTPGTGTSRRKRVSFGHDVLDKGPAAHKSRSRRDTSRKRTRLTEVMEQSKRDKTPEKWPTPEIPEESDGDWEEEEDDQDDYCNHDVTIDLNEPHSRSGKYWKSNFEKYHEDARAEMEKLLKYKQLAKSYAKMKDAEALDLHEKLREEQGKVLDMEKKLREMAAQIGNRRLKGKGKEDERETAELMKDMARQTALAVQYRSQVKELESMLKKGGDDEDSKRRRGVATSPRTAKTLLETQRELRKARTQLREMDGLKDEIKQLKSDLRSSEQRAAKLLGENKNLGRRDSNDDSEVQALKTELQEARAESRKKDDDLRRLRREYEQFREESTTQQEDTKRVLEKATDKISGLKKEIRALKASKDTGNGRPRSFHATSCEADPHPAEKADLHLDLKDLARLTSVDSSREGRSSRQGQDLATEEGREDRRTLAPRTLREKFQDPTESLEVDVPMPVRPTSNVLTSRINLERPKWRPYIPRSPRNRAYLTGDSGKRAAATAGPTTTDANDFDILDTNRPQKAKAEIPAVEEGREDPIKERFRHLALPDMNSSATMSANTSRSALPPERRAAALARIEQRKADKRRADRVKGVDKENVRPRAVEA